MTFNKISTCSFLVLAIPIDVAKCVFPTPLGPKNTMFSCCSKKRREIKSKICCLLILGWKSKSNTSTSFR